MEQSQNDAQHGGDPLPPEDRAALGWSMWEADSDVFFICKCVAIPTPQGWQAPASLDEWQPDPDCSYCNGYGIVPGALFPREWGWHLIEQGRGVPCRTCIGRSTPATFDEFLPDPTCPHCGGTGCWLIEEEDVETIEFTPDDSWNIKSDPFDDETFKEEPPN